MKDKITIGDKYGPAMQVQTEEEAQVYFELCVEHTMRFGKSREEAEEIERQNIGYFAGYYSPETMARVNKLFKTVHPILGTSDPSPEEAFEAGLAMAKKVLKED